MSTQRVLLGVLAVVSAFSLGVVANPDGFITNTTLAPECTTHPDIGYANHRDPIADA